MTTCNVPASDHYAHSGYTIPCDLPEGHEQMHHWGHPDAPLCRPPRTYTVVGFWRDDEVEICGIIKGEHDVFGGDSVTEEGPWAGHFTCYETDQEKVHDLALEFAAGATEG